MSLKSILTSFLILLTTISVKGQDSPKLTFGGNFRLALTTAGTESGFEEGTYALRSRVGALYTFDATHSFKTRLATTITDEFEELSFTIQPDGRGLSRGSISFDEFYYQYKKGNTQLKFGRFQHSIKVKTNAGRSIARFGSNHINIHWFDGIYWKQKLNNGWASEVVLEYQKRDHISYSYRAPLTFANNDHNFAGYFELENDSRDDLNIIQKGFGLYVAPDAYLKPEGYSSYIAFISRIAFDFPQEALNGGSIRVAGEYGQNLNTNFGDGLIAVTSIGVNNVADQHEFMIEFAKNGRDWLMANVYAPNADELEFRYRFFLNDQLNFDARYRIRDSRVDGVATVKGFFLRSTFSF